MLHVQSALYIRPATHAPECPHRCINDPPRMCPGQHQYIYIRGGALPVVKTTYWHAHETPHRTHTRAGRTRPRARTAQPKSPHRPHPRARARDRNIYNQLLSFKTEWFATIRSKAKVYISLTAIRSKSEKGGRGLAHLLQSVTSQKKGC